MEKRQGTQFGKVKLEIALRCSREGDASAAEYMNLESRRQVKLKVCICGIAVVKNCGAVGEQETTEKEQAKR